MKIIISPAKKMNNDQHSLPQETSPIFQKETQEIIETLQQMTEESLQKLWKCNDSIAKLNIQRLRQQTPEYTPAIFSYEGIQYQYMAPNVFEQEHLDYISRNLAIISGFYGMLRPLDAVTPYRLEMQAKLQIREHKSLYHFWGDKLAKELEKDTDIILNLASNEYSKAVLPHLNTPHINFTFGELKEEKVVEKGTLCKMARGQMVRWLAENNINKPKNIQDFSDLNFKFSPSRSTEQNFVFIKTPEKSE